MTCINRKTLQELFAHTLTSLFETLGTFNTRSHCLNSIRLTGTKRQSRCPSRFMCSLIPDLPSLCQQRALFPSCSISFHRMKAAWFQKKHHNHLYFHSTGNIHWFKKLFLRYSHLKHLHTFTKECSVVCCSTVSVCAVTSNSEPVFLLCISHTAVIAASRGSWRL